MNVVSAEAMPRGGKRPGAGRPHGSKNSYKSVRGFGPIREARRALRGAPVEDKIPEVPKGHRIPPDASASAREAADWAFQRYIDVAAGRVHSKKAGNVVKAAKEIRNEVCGPIAQKVDVDVKGRLEFLLSESMKTDGAEATSAPAPDATEK